MRYEKRFLHRIQEDFLIIGADDYDDLVQSGMRYERFVELSMDALLSLRYFPDVEYLILTPGEVSADGIHMLDGLKIKALKLDYYTYELDLYTIDLGLFPCVELVFARTQYCINNISQCRSLQTLIVQEWLAPDLAWLENSSIKALKICSGKLKALSGLEMLPGLISLSISNQRQLVDYSVLALVSLESIEIVACNKIDIMALPPLPTTRMMHISGKQKLTNVESILSIAPKLEWLLLDHIVVDGAIADLCRLSHAVVFTDCRHYSHKNCDLPKSAERYHSNFLPVGLEILPEA